MGTFSGSQLPMGEYWPFPEILGDEEIVVVANTNVAEGTSVDVIVDIHLNRPGARFEILYSNKGATTRTPVHEIRAATVVAELKSP
jgi:hypothetical protein